MHLFHYHLVTSRVREVEARYIGKLGFDLIARHGRIGEDLTSYEAGTSWTELDAIGFKLRLSELELGSVNVVVQPGQWPLPRVDHLGLALDEDEFEAALARAEEAELRVQEHGGRRTFVLALLLYLVFFLSRGRQSRRQKQAQSQQRQAAKRATNHPQNLSAKSVR